MAERLNTIVDRVLSGLLGDSEHAEKQRPPLMLDMLSDWLPYRVYDPSSRLYFNARSKGFILSVTPIYARPAPYRHWSGRCSGCRDRISRPVRSHNIS